MRTGELLRSQVWTLTLVGDWQQFVENGTTQNRTHGPTHELIAIDGQALTYDPKGNLTQDHFGKQYAWDFDNMLQSVTVPASAAQAGQGIEGTHTYEYLCPCQLELGGFFGFSAERVRRGTTRSWARPSTNSVSFQERSTRCSPAGRGCRGGRPSLA